MMGQTHGLVHKFVISDHLVDNAYLFSFARIKPTCRDHQIHGLPKAHQARERMSKTHFGDNPHHGKFGSKLGAFSGQPEVAKKGLPKAGT